MGTRESGGAPWHRASYRHALIDMHIPDWDPAFLKNYNPAEIADYTKTATVGAVMSYFQSHIGLCYWPTKSGKQHTAAQGRDLAGDAVREFHARGIPVCGYYSVNFNNWAYLEHPDWRLHPVVDAPLGGGVLPAARYGLCCLNSPKYRKFISDQTDEVVGNYDLDAIFFDMVWWQSVCACEHCRRRYKSETNKDIPETIDWFNKDWCQFQQAREQWLTEFAFELRNNARRLKPNIVVYHNFATAMTNWIKAVSFDSAAAHDFLGGDFYGGREEQLVVSRLMLNLSESRPVEFMTTVAANLAEHERLQSKEDLELQALAATACGASFLMIAAINPDGTPQKEAFRRIGDVFRQTQKYEEHLGGDPIEDIVIYFSSYSKMNFNENGTRLIGATSAGAMRYPHFEAVRGACSKLQAAHIPFGVITRKQLGSLRKYKVIILPNLLRIDSEEVAAFREYVNGGGKIYASRESSLTESSGARHDNFLLADLFGCSFDELESGRIIYLKPIDKELKNALGSELLVSHWRDKLECSGAVRLNENVAPSATVLARLNIPYGYPHGGSVQDQKWSSIHSSPPWKDVVAPTVVENKFGRGRTIYSAADIEAAATSENAELFIHLVRRLLGEDASFECDVHPAVWVTAFIQLDRSRIIASFLNYQARLPVIPIRNASFKLRSFSDKKFSRVRDLTNGKEMKFSISPNGTLHTKIDELEKFRMIAVEYE